MPIPETPYTRKESYLNAIATGDSDGIPETPYTREEMYLDAIAKCGGGGGGGGGSSTLSGLTDVDISNPSNGQTLVYNSTSGKWENGAGGGGDGWSQYQVTFINSGSAGTRYTVDLGSCALSDGNTSVYFIQTAVIVEEQITVTLYQPNGLAVLLQGISFTDVDYSVTPVVTGNIEFSAELGFVITGNGTITLSAQPVN